MLAQPKLLALVVLAGVVLLHTVASHSNTYTYPQVMTRKPRHNKYVGCYYQNKVIYRDDVGILKIEQHLQPAHMFCTHLIYAFADIDRDHRIKMGDTFADTVQSTRHNGYQEFTKMRYHFPGLKTMLSVGGPDFDYTKFSEMAKTSDRRRTFIRSVTDFLRLHNFEGLDVWWELYYPGRVGHTDDKENMVQLFKELRIVCREHGFKLTATLTSQYQDFTSPEDRRNKLDPMNAIYEVRKISEYVDYLHIKTYDQNQHTFNNRDGRTVIYPNSPLDEINKTLEILIEDYNIRPEKLIIGLPTFGRGYITKHRRRNPTENPIGKLALNRKDWIGLENQNPNVFLYSEVCNLIRRKAHTNGEEIWEERWDGISRTPFAVHDYYDRVAMEELTKVIVYDNEKSLKAKVHEVLRRNAGGVFVWTLDYDDFKGECKQPYRKRDQYDPFDDPKFPLLHAIAEALESSGGISNGSSFSILTLALLTLVPIYGL